MPEEKPFGRPQKNFTDDDWIQMDAYARVGCSGENISNLMECSYDTVCRNIKDKYNLTFPEWFNQRFVKTIANARKTHALIATDVNKAMKAQRLTELFLKNYCGVTDRVETVHQFNKDEKLQIDLSGKGFEDVIPSAPEANSIPQE
jgi:hypothetical protein